MTNTKKQAKLAKLFRKKKAKIPEETDELQEEVRQLEQKLREKHDELFQIKRNMYRHRSSVPQKKIETFIRPKEIVYSNSIDKLKRDLVLMSMLTGLEVQSYVENEYCCIVYHIQCTTQQEVKHGLRINLRSDERNIEKISMPVGFNINGVIEEFEKLMSSDCLSAIRNGLVAYYDRSEQFKALQTLLVLDAQLFRVLDSSHIEIRFSVQSNTDQEDEEHIQLLLALDYSIYDIRPRSITFREKDLPEGMVDVLNVQCVAFKRKPLAKAFKEAFLQGIGRYNIVRQLEDIEEPPQKRIRPNGNNYNNDDTFLPEDCSEPSDVDEE